MALGRTVRCTERELKLGQMGASTLETSMKIEKKVKGCSHGKMAASMMDPGRMGNSMESEKLRERREKSSKGNGLKARGSAGLTIKKTE